MLIGLTLYRLLITTINDLHFCVTQTKVNAYADNNQLHFSHECPTAIETAINEDLKES